MNKYSFRLLLIASLLSFAGSAPAQTPLAAVPKATPSSANLKKDMEAIGEKLNDDRVDMYDRYVFDDDQTIDKKVALRLPVYPNQDVEEWLRDNIAPIMTVSPASYPGHIRKIVPYFVPKGLQQFQIQWEKTGVRQLVIEQNYSMTGLIVDRPHLVAKGRLKDVYHWIYDVPVFLTYNKSTTPPTLPISFNVKLRIGLTRIPMQANNQLIAIDQWDLTPPPPPEPEKEE
ncbi:MAG TPA: DotI/IcmL family type IV secretion protein [Alphaproteobacteria bacterium]